MAIGHHGSRNSRPAYGYEGRYTIEGTFRGWPRQQNLAYNGRRHSAAAANANPSIRLAAGLGHSVARLCVL
jgi:hypothetical protein